MPYFVVIRERGDAWDWSRPMRRQDRFGEHAEFMDALTESGFILAGGPLGTEDEAPRVLHIVEAADENAVRLRLGGDPWKEGMLRLISVEPWTVLLGGFGAAR